MSFGIRGKSPSVSRSLLPINPVAKAACIEPLEARQLLSFSPFKPAGFPNLGASLGMHATPDPTVDGSVTGNVTDSSGMALSNAIVYLKPVSSSGSGANPSDLFGGFGRLVAQTDSSGNFTLSSVPANTYTATAFKQGYTATTSASFTVTAGNSTTVPTIALPAVQFGTVTGTVDDSTGAPLSGALVFLKPDNSSGGVAPILSGIADGGHFFATTDSSGNYTINNVPTGSYTATGTDHGYESSTTASFTVATGSNTAPTIMLTAKAAVVTGTVTGLVTDSTGAPLSDALVTLSVPSSTGSTTEQHFEQLFATTDSSGNYTINNVPTGTYVVNASDKGYVKNSSASFTVAQGSNTAPTVALTAVVTGTVTGNVTDSNGSPLSGARVTLTLATSSTTSTSAKSKASLASVFGGGGGDRFFTATTDSSGNYTINNVPTGNYTVNVFDKGYQSSTGTALTVAAGSNTVPTIMLTALPTPVFGSLTGKVTDSSGTEITNARVIIAPVASTSGSTTTSAHGLHAHFYFARTDSTGTFVLSKVLAGTYTITAFARGFMKNTSASFTVASGTNTAPTVALTASTTTGSGSNSGSPQ